MECTKDQIISRSIKDFSTCAEKLPGVVIIHDLRDWTVAWMSQRGLTELNVQLAEITALTSKEYYSRYFNEEDSRDYAPKVLSLMERNIANEICTCFQQVRFRVDGDWNWHMASTMVFERDNDGKPLLAITMAFPIDNMHYMTAKAERLLKENNFLRTNLSLFSKLSKRECEILKYLALGKSSVETGKEMFISAMTVETHRKNIKKKLNTNSFFELSEFARAFDLV